MASWKKSPGPWPWRRSPGAVSHGPTAASDDCRPCAHFPDEDTEATELAGVCQMSRPGRCVCAWWPRRPPFVSPGASWAPSLLGSCLSTPLQASTLTSSHGRHLRCLHRESGLLPPVGPQPRGSPRLPSSGGQDHVVGHVRPWPVRIWPRGGGLRGAATAVGSGTAPRVWFPVGTGLRAQVPWEGCRVLTGAAWGRSRPGPARQGDGGAAACTSPVTRSRSPSSKLHRELRRQNRPHARRRAAGCVGRALSTRRGRTGKGGLTRATAGGTPKTCC